MDVGQMCREFHDYRTKTYTMKITISIIIVNYRIKEELFNCLKSIKISKTKYSNEVIVIDNSEVAIDKTELTKKYPWVKYIHNPENPGFGAANNLGAKYAKGKYLFFLNPDTELYKGSIDKLIQFMEEDQTAAIVAPLLLDKDKNPYTLQGTSELTPIKGLAALSFINKLFPNNPVSRSYWLYWDKKIKKEVDVVPGTAFVISKKVFEKVNGFDKNFFLYFEEADICKRVKKLGYKIYIIPDSKVYHEWGASTKKIENINEIFSKSRFLYFKKHFGYMPAILVWLITSMNRNHLFILLIMLIALFLRLYNIDKLMIFMADQGWFYLSARDIFSTGNIPLVGIPSSVVWLKQGPLATYMIYIALLLGKFNPVSPAILFTIVDLFTIYLIFVIGKKFFNYQTGLLAGALYAVSPRVIVNIRMPYHTSPIPFFACLLFLILYYILHNKKYSLLLLLGFVLGILMQLELSNGVIIFVLLFIWFIYKIPLKRDHIIRFFAGLIAGIIPFILYDVQHGFIQILGFPLWVINRVRLFFGLTWSGNSTTAHVPGAIFTNWQEMTRIIFPASALVVFVIFIAILLLIMKDRHKLLRNNPGFGFVISILWLVIPMIGFTIHAAPGSAYFPLLYPIITIFVGLIFYKLIKKFKIAVFIYILFLFINILHIFNNNFYMISKDIIIDCRGGTFCLSSDLNIRQDIAEFIVQDSKGTDFAVKGGGFLSTFTTGVDNYKYLIWWRGGNMADNAKTVYIIYESKTDIPQSENVTYYNSFYSVVKHEKK